MAKLEGKVAIVTGASRGIAAAIPFAATAPCFANGIASLHAHRLAKDGATVVINYARSAEQAQELVSAIEASGGKALAVQADVSQVTDIRHLFQEAIAQFGRLDILVNKRVPLGDGTAHRRQWWR